MIKENMLKRINSNGQSVVEYVILIGITLAVILIFLASNGRFHESLEGTIERVSNASFSEIDSIVAP